MYVLGRGWVGRWVGNHRLGRSVEWASTSQPLSTPLNPSNPSQSLQPLRPFAPSPNTHTYPHNSPTNKQTSKQQVLCEPASQQRERESATYCCREVIGVPLGPVAALEAESTSDGVSARVRANEGQTDRARQPPIDVRFVRHAGTGPVNLLFVSRLAPR